MPRITRAARRRRGLLTVYVDGDYWKTLDVDAAEERGIFEGAELSEEELESAGASAENALALRRAVNFLGYRARSEGEVRQRLRCFEHTTEAIESAVARLYELGYLDDREFARSFASEKASKDRWGPRRIRAELLRRGVPDSLASEAVASELSGRSEEEDARNLAETRYNTSERSESRARRVYQYLARRGYSPEVCATVAREYRNG
jgi:regulatory protein